MTRHPQRHYRGRDNSRAAVHCSEDSRELQGFRHPRLAGDSPGFAARLMLARGGGNIFFTGATASLRGSSGYAAFASAKFGLRAVAQLMARELGPKNFHVAHLIIDSGVDTAWVRERREQIWGKEALDNPDLLMPPASVAGAYWQLYRQPKSAWTFEMEIRPFGEKW